MVMVLLCLFWAVCTFIRRGFLHFTSTDCIIYSILRFNKIWITRFEFFSYRFILLALSVTLMCSFAIFTFKIQFLIVFLINFTFFGLSVFLIHNNSARFTVALKTIISSSIFVKFRNCFELLALSTSFCFNCFRHGLFLLKKGSCLEPVAAHTAVGSLYFD